MNSDSAANGIDLPDTGGLNNRVRVTAWRGVGDREASLDFRCDERIAYLPFTDAIRRYRFLLDPPRSGSLVLRVWSPRPLRMSCGGVQVLDEHLGWRSFQRALELLIIVPASRSNDPFEIEVGQRPQHPKGVDDSCPSRNREALMKRLALEFPDELRVQAEHRADPGAAVAMRFSPSQFHRDGVVWQRVYARNLCFDDAGPTINAYQYEDKPSPALSIRSTIGPCESLEATSAAERGQGVRRFYVPVGLHTTPDSPLRTTGIEPRSEPRLEVVRSTSVEVGTAGGTSRVDIPVYESLGRHAPRREFRPTSWPTLDQVLAAAPEPVLPPQWRHYAQLYREAWAMLLRLTRPGDPLSGLPGGYVNTGTNFPHYVFLWDTSFTALAAAYAWRAFPVTDSLDLQYSRQFDGGYIHREHDTRDGLPIIYEPDFSPNPPMAAIAEWKIASLTGNVHRLQRVWPVLRGYHEWIRNNRQLADGTYWTTGLANGLDNSPSLGDGYPDLSAQMAHAAEVLARIASRLGDEQGVSEMRAQRETIADAINRHLWSDSMQFYATSTGNGSHNPNKVVTGFWPLWAGVVPPERVEALARHATDPATFFRHHPLPSVAADSPHYATAGDYWLGSTWAPTNYAAIKGFARSGRIDVARLLTLKHLQCMHETYIATGKLWENYAPDTSEPGSWSAPDYCWTALGPIALLLETLIGIEPDAMAMTIRWRLPEASCGVRRYPLGGATLELSFDQDRGQVRVGTDRPIRICVESGFATATETECSAGWHTIAVRQKCD